MTAPTNHDGLDRPLSAAARWAVLAAAFAGLLFDGIELGLMPVASLSVSRSMLGTEFTDTLAGDWFAKFTASLMLGAAVGGIALGNLGDRSWCKRRSDLCSGSDRHWVRSGYQRA